jgi:hypothetical protein
VRLILPDAGFQMTVESLSGDLMMTTAPTPAKDGKGGHWVSTLLGRSFHISRDAAGAAARFSGAVGVVSGKRIP